MWFDVASSKYVQIPSNTCPISLIWLRYKASAQSLGTNCIAGDLQKTRPSTRSRSWWDEDGSGWIRIQEGGLTKFDKRTVVVCGCLWCLCLVVFGCVWFVGLAGEL